MCRVADIVVGEDVWVSIIYSNKVFVYVYVCICSSMYMYVYVVVCM